jgi:hypothetical protein
MNGISHVWGTLMELKLDLKLLEGSSLNSDTNPEEPMEETE